jgi:aconitate hydratase
MWDRKDIKKGELNTIVTSYNRNFKKRNDGNEETLAFIGSPELVTAIAFFGTLDANPLTDSIPVNSHHFKFKEPSGSFAPEKGFVISYDGYQPPELDPQKRSTIQIIIDPGSERLTLLPEFEPWDGKDFEDLIVLFKAVGKCTTDHISPAGPWLRYRGHLDKISNNLLLGAYNAFTNSTGQSLNLLTGQVSTPSEVARHYKEANISWVIVGEENYGEGSSREHAAMTPRYLGCKAVIAKSFARIHETNLKKQGVLPLTFCNPSDYDLITQNSRLSILGLQNLSESNKVKCVIKNEGQSVEIILQHSLADEEIEWFKKGSALNMFKK